MKCNSRHMNKGKRRTAVMLCLCFALIAMTIMANNSVFGFWIFITNADKYIDDDPPEKIEIIHSDVLFKRANDPRADVLVGHVKLKHEGAILDCDSARYYKDSNSFYAFGKVVLVQGDTLKLLCVTLDYYGDSRVAKARGRGKLYHKDRRLESNKMEYNRLRGEAKYYEGGTIYQGDKVPRTPSPVMWDNTTPIRISPFSRIMSC